jgi:hypothetical protein
MLGSVFVYVGLNTVKTSWSFLPCGRETKSALSALVQRFVQSSFSGVTSHFRRRFDCDARVAQTPGIERTPPATLDQPPEQRRGVRLGPCWAGSQRSPCQPGRRAVGRCRFRRRGDHQRVRCRNHRLEKCSLGLPKDSGETKQVAYRSGARQRKPPANWHSEAVGVYLSVGRKIENRNSG